jgi:uncharacterized membrane protein YfcA
MPTEILISIIIFLGGTVYATFGFGDALFAMPFLTLLIGIKTATPLMTLNGLTLSAWMMIRHFKTIDWKAARRLVLASFLGVPIGIYFLKHGNEQFAKLLLGVVICCISVYNLYFKKEHVHLNKNWAYAFGFVAGILGGAFNTGGPSVVIFGSMSGWTQLQFISTLQCYFFPNGIFIVICQLFAGLLTPTIFIYYLKGLPFLLLGLLAGSRLRKKIPDGKFNRYVFVLLLMIGILFVVRTLLYS